MTTSLKRFFTEDDQHPEKGYKRHKGTGHHPTHNDNKLLFKRRYQVVTSGNKLVVRRRYTVQEPKPKKETVWVINLKDPSVVALLMDIDAVAIQLAQLLSTPVSIL